jgi:short-subunit dehydrogenase
MDDFTFAGKTCVITGAAGGIGAALAQNIARRKVVLVLIDKDAEALADVAEVAERHGGADLLINNAGVALSGTFEQVSMKDFDWLMEINLHAVIRMTKAFLPQLLSRPGSHVVNLSSLFGLIAPPTQVAYATSKFGVRGFSEALRHELAGRVGVTVVHPGGIKTNIAANARLSGPDLTGEQRERARKFAEAALTMPPEQAARQIVVAIQARRPRLVITRAAKGADLLARLTPSRYWSISERLAKRRAAL